MKYNYVAGKGFRKKQMPHTVERQREFEHNNRVDTQNILGSRNAANFRKVDNFNIKRKNKNVLLQFYRKDGD